ncbi:hypothetical protein [Sulfurirhabdus autotrophica]|uniref:Uncharacterized protein n=1 Tax=Sulfurirhabdus autotrophica TaxID=1706046 RepID=A0A4R3Y5C6_9PROT|nr:hypothetical protein [Sulfurirhabdus autotrophica]TCV85363.1 hypothetical protein EDC63_10934 [Sulfurirhabdus autotrophica]
MPEINPQVIVFLQELAEQKSDYICTSTLPDTQVSLRFTSNFQKRPVIWDTSITTLQHYYQNRDQDTGLQFMEIQESSDSIYKLTVGLNLPIIDIPVIKKTIIMIRNYKLLRIGRHEWGKQS